jgi:hypothetical protein
MPKGQYRRKGVRQHWAGPESKKSGNKNPNLTVHRLVARIADRSAKNAADEAALAALRAAKSPQTVEATRSRTAAAEDEPPAKDYGDQRVVIKYFYELFKSPPEFDAEGRSNWDDRYGTISRIRDRMVGAKPDARTVRGVLRRLAAGDQDVAWNYAGGNGPGSKLSSGEDLLVGALAVQGMSQDMALTLVNAECESAGKEPVSRRTLQRAEDRVQLRRHAARVGPDARQDHRSEGKHRAGRSAAQRPAREARRRRRAQVRAACACPRSAARAARAAQAEGAKSVLLNF